MKAPYIDIHAHHALPTEDSKCVFNLSLDDLRQELQPHESATAGIHPWWFEDLSREEISALKINIESLATKEKLWGIGESGIDRAYPEFLTDQKELFRWHWELAERFRLPLVIHNVRSGSDFLEVLKAKTPSTPWIFHDFRGNEQLVSALLKHQPQSYFSFGLSLDNSPQIRELIQLIPLQNLFLETDSQKHLDIHDIYLRASEQLGIDLDFLKSQVWLNFKKVSAGQ